MKTTLVLSTLLVLVAACSREPAVTETAPEVSVYAAAIASESRPATDRDSDARRKPEAVLEFFGIQPGDVVLEMWAPPGYYTELLSLVVGEKGRVYAHANTPIVNFAGDAHTERHADGRLPNVEILFAENNELSLEADSFDAATIILNYHDLYWSSEQYGWDPIDIPAFLAEIYKALKPGGTLGIVDHRATAGSPPETGSTVHRIDPAIVIADLEGAGFVLDGESDVLANPEDDLDLLVFDPSVRGNTDRFVLRFRKPE